MDKSLENAVEQTILKLLENIGEDLQREGLKKTPQRVVNLFKSALSGYTQDPFKKISLSTYENQSTPNQMITVTPIPFFSLCEHHLTPFFGSAHIAYIPKSRIIGLSHLPKLVDIFAHRLQIQERLTEDIANSIETLIQPLGIIVMLEGLHSCNYFTGVKNPHVKMKTISIKGNFEKKEHLVKRALQLFTSSE